MSNSNDNDNNVGMANGEKRGGVRAVTIEVGDTDAAAKSIPVGEEKADQDKVSRRILMASNC